MRSSVSTHPPVRSVSPVCLLGVFQICDSVGLAKQIAFHSEMVRVIFFFHLCFTEAMLPSGVVVKVAYCCHLVVVVSAGP